MSSIWPPKWQVIIIVLLLCFVYIISRFIPKKYDIPYLVFLVIAGYLIVSYLVYSKNCENFSENSNSLNNHICTGKNNSESVKLLPILESSFNLRECAKQMILLEEHLENPKKRCMDCCKKHLLTLEGLAEEGITINGDSAIHNECYQLAQQIRDWEKEFVSPNVNYENLGQKIRKVRKPLMQKYFDQI